MRPPPVPPKPLKQSQSPPLNHNRSPEAEPLFLPCSQLSQAEIQVLRSTGLGIEEMNADELAEMLEGEGEEVDFPPSQKFPSFWDQKYPSPDSMDLVDELGATQSSEEHSRVRPLFSTVLSRG